MENHHVREAALYASRNKEKLSESQICGCYKCFAIQPVSEIKEWTDNGETAICPNCSTDCVLPDVLVPISDDTLKEINNYWFNKK